MPEDLWQALYDAGLFHFVLPKDVGGHGVSLPDSLRIYESLAETDASTGWCVAIGAGAAALGSMMDPAVARATLWSQPLGVVVGTFMRSGRAVQQGDSYLVSGRWAFSSASVGAGWYVAHCVVFDGEESRLDEEGNQVIVALPVPMSECTIEDTWDSPGLRGTGSHHVAISGAVVPVDYGFSLLSEAQRGTPLECFPIFAMLDCYLAAIMTGVVKGALNDLLQHFGARAGEKGGLESFPASVALEFASLLAEARAWRSLLFGSVDALWEQVAQARENAGEVPDDGFDVRLASKMAARRGPGLISAMTLMAGGRALLEAPDLQRRLRDAHAIASHLQFSTPVAAAIGQAAIQRYAASVTRITAP